MFIAKWPFRRKRVDHSDLEVGVDIRIYRRMQYLYELNVPLRYRWNHPVIEWEMVCNNYRNIVYDADYFRNDEKLQDLLSLQDKQKSILKINKV